MKKKTGMKKLITNLFLALIILLIISGIFTLYSGPFEESERISFSTLVNQINQGEVEKITIEENDLSIELKDGSKKKSYKESDASLTQSLINYGVSQESLNKIKIDIKQPSGLAVWAINVLPFFLPLLIIGFFLWFMFKQAQKGQTQALSFGKSQARLTNPLDKKKKITFDDVAGLEEAKQELREIVDFLKHPKKFINIGARIPCGVLLMGAPGTGKTMLARAVSGQANVPFYHISASEFVEMFVGVGASRVRNLFKTAKKNSPSIVFVDEIDAVGRHRGAGLGGGHDEREQTLNQILVEMDGFDQDTNVIVIAATNRPDILDPALLRPGRFDRRIVLNLPDIKERKKILEIHTKNKKLAKNVNLRHIAERTPGFSGADLANLVNEAAILTAKKNKKTVSQQSLISSIEKVLLGPERKSHILSKEEKEISAYHEAGHALVAASLPDADPVHKVSIVARGKAAGYTLKLPIKDKHLRSRSEFIADLAVLLGGYCAEKMIFKELTTGAASDLQQASELARDLVTRYGMSEKLGPLTFGGGEGTVFLGKEITEQRNYSEKVAAKIDQEIEKLIRNAQKTANQILKKKRKKLEQIAKTLIKKETIERKEFEKLTKSKKKK